MGKSIAEKIEEELIYQEAQGYITAQTLSKNGWSKSKLTRYSITLDIAITALEDLQYQNGFNRFITELGND